MQTPDQREPDGIDGFLACNPDSPIVLDLLGTLDPAAIREHVHHLDADVDKIFFFTASVGAVFGISRTNGSRAAIKVNKLIEDETYYDQVQGVQATLADSGYPAPSPLGRHGLVVWEQWLDDGEFRDAHDPEVRTAMAYELSRFHTVATATGVRPRRSFLRPAGALWPKPHNALFDIENTAAGAEWIDDIARAALRYPEVGDPVVGHTDWSAKHLRFDDSLSLTALYDWDSVTTDVEPALVGTAAGSFTYTEELAYPIELWPTADESAAFIDDYEHARGKPFTNLERKTALGACVYLRAYAARCQHAYAGSAHESGLEAFAGAILG